MIAAALRMVFCMSVTIAPREWYRKQRRAIPELDGGEPVNAQKYKVRLLALERQLDERLGRPRANVRDRGDESAGDAGDGRVADELRDEQFGEAEMDRVRLAEVREALG